MSKGSRKSAATLARIDRVAHDFIVVDSATAALCSTILNLILDDSVDRVRCVEGRVLRDPSDLLPLHICNLLLASRFDQVLEDASAWKRRVLLDTVVVLLDELRVLHRHAVTALFRRSWIELVLRVDRVSSEFLHGLRVNALLR